MVITCVTSRYLPNLRYIARLCEADYVVVLDLAPLPHQNKNSFVSRNRICDSTGELLWLSVPISRKGVRDIQNAKTEPTQRNWIDKHIKNIARVYPNHKMVAGDFLERLAMVLRGSDGSLIDINTRSLRLILQTLKLYDVRLLMQSSIAESHVKDHRLNIANSLGANDYVAGRVEWGVMERSGCIERMQAAGVSVYVSPELDKDVFPVEKIERCSCLHFMCTLGPDITRSLVYEIVRLLRKDTGRG